MPQIRSSRWPKASATHVAGALLALSLAWTTAPQLVERARYATHLAPLDDSARRADILGASYTSISAVKRALPPRAPVAIVMRTHADADLAVFVNYFLFPHPTRWYEGAQTYLADPQRPPYAVWLDRSVSNEARLVTPEELARR